MSGRTQYASAGRLGSAILNGVIAFGATLLIACSDSATSQPETQKPAPVVARVAVSPEQGSLLVGRTLQLRAYPLTASGDTLRDRAVAWRTADAAVAVVSQDGVVTGVTAGTVAVYAKSGSVENAAFVSVAQRAVASIELDVSTLELEEGATSRATVIARDDAGEPVLGRAVQWTTEHANVAIVSADGTITALAWGATTVRATVEGKSATATVRVNSRIAFDLLFDSRTGFGNEPQLYNLDVRSPLSAPTRVFPANGGTWDVTPSPDGSKLAFVARTESSVQIHVANRDGSGLRQITAGGGGADQPAWSPDGNRIAFRRWNAGGPPGIFNRADIWVVNADGTGTTNVTAENAPLTSAEWPTWSPRQADGSYRIAYSLQSKPGEYLVGRIMSVRADGSDKVAMTLAGSQLDNQPAWSPDGAFIVFVRIGGTAAGDLWMFRTVDRVERQLMTNDPADDQRSPSWSPDGSLIAFASKHEPGIDGNYAYQLYTVSPIGTGLLRRTSSGIDKENPVWIPRP
jgi:dipeptidyl aminopeptidase/acylaminoacyl peptidase